MGEKKIYESPPPHPDSWKLLKLPSLCLSFHLARALGGCVLTGPFCSTQSLFCGHPFFSHFPCKVFAKKNRVFSFSCAWPYLALRTLAVHRSCFLLVSSLVLRTLFITLRGETLLILFLDLLALCLERRSLTSVVLTSRNVSGTT